DIKPDNLIFDEVGNLHLTDFNVAAVLPEGGLASSIAGTKPYMAPEVFLTSLRQAEGYSFPADWWSLGMTLYEMHRLKRPYDLSGDMSSADCLSSIQSAGVRYSTSTSSQLRAAVQALLEPDPNQRLSSLTQVKSHPFTRQLDWDRLLAKAAQPAFRPPRHQLNCDPTFELEEMIIESKPLHKKHKRLSKLGSSSDRSSEDNPTARALADIESTFPTFNRQR
uniref:Protein kinase domain-containing protein n=1 Tax=Macrostomum lignano TaxID=282301 RepID=A0A1I8IBJ6_9PLAT